MERLGLEALSQKPRTARGHLLGYSYLLRNLAITCANQVWAMDKRIPPLCIWSP